MDPMGMFSASVPRQRVQSQHLLPLAGLPWPCWGAWGQETVRSSASPSTVSPQVTIKQCMAGAQNYHQTAQVITLDTTSIMNLQSSSIFTIVTIVHVRIRMGKKELSYAAMPELCAIPWISGCFSWWPQSHPFSVIPLEFPYMSHKQCHKLNQIYFSYELRSCLNIEHLKVITTCRCS